MTRRLYSVRVARDLRSDYNDHVCQHTPIRTERTQKREKEGRIKTMKEELRDPGHLGDEKKRGKEGVS